MRGMAWECRRVLKNRWVYLAAAVTVGILWFEVSGELDILRFGEEEAKRELLKTVLCAQENLLFLPLLCCLPGASGIYQELRTGAARYKIFRCGYRAYVTKKLLALLLSAVLSQWLGAALFQGTFSLAGGLWIPIPGHVLLRRMIAAGIFAMAGNVGALLTKDTVSAYVFPVVLAFSLSMLQTRFFFSLPCINPAVWISGEGQSLSFLTVLFGCTGILTAVFTDYEVKRYV